MLTITTISIAELQADPRIDAMVAGYASESALDGMPQPTPHWPMYATLEGAGALTVLAARVDGELAGFALMLYTLNPHYSVGIAATESLFVDPAHRGSGAGLGLIRACRAKARSLGAVGLFISAPIGSRLEALLECDSDNVPTNRVFFRSLA